ncbi:cell envelope integrity protein TolA [Archangium violaceum]|uniref:cell envelope integrity protein TolA n=1 Tax=Archangium violaceum TaxID=83451 RepID=UPI00193B5E93|nr:cell envelope integrity protein TolA [Archangium violaceum]QRK11608.1 cell envelope integrity protein TolA [Archangium violaceum]
MAIQQQFFLKEDESGVGVDTNIVETGGKDGTILRVFPVDNYSFPEEIKRLAKEWHVIKVPLLGQRVHASEQVDWCGRTSCSMLYNYFQLIKGGDPRERYITHSRAGDPECLPDLRFPSGERAFFEVPFDPSLPKKGWTIFPERKNYEVQSDCAWFGLDPDGEVPLPISQIFPARGPRPTGLGGILRYRASSSYKDEKGHLLPEGLRHEADDIKNSEKRLRERFAHLIECLRANNPVVIYTGFGSYSKKMGNPLHIIVIAGYCILQVGGEEQLWLVTADPSTKIGLVSKGRLSAPHSGGNVDLGSRIGPGHMIFRMRSGLIAKSSPLMGFASFNLVRARTFFEKNPEVKDSEYDLFLDHSRTHCGRYVYREKRTEVPAEVLDSSFSRPRYSFPLRGNNASSSPWQCFYNNESLDTGIGGYYLLGLQRNLHGGIHLFPPADQEFVPVSAVAPGYIVAARLPGEKAPCRKPGVAEALGNWPGFVLVRHELEETPKESQQGGTAQSSQASPRRGVFYTLYMHLRSPIFPPSIEEKAQKAAASQKPQNAPAASQKPQGTGSVQKTQNTSAAQKKEEEARKKAEIAASALDRYFQEVPWFRELYKRRFGAWVCISGDKPGAMVWSQEPVPEADRKPPNAGQQGAGKKTYKVLTQDGTAQEISLRNKEGQEEWLYKAPPANLEEALVTLAQGDVVTFMEPFFPVNIGELLGFSGPLPDQLAILSQDFRVQREDSELAEKRKRFEVRSGFLHFQVFSPEKDKENGIKLLLELARQIETGSGRLPEFVEVKEDSEDNFLTLEEIEKHLKGALPEEDRNAFSKLTQDYFSAAKKIDRSGFGYGPLVASLLDSTTSFAPKSEKPDWKSCCRFEYPLTLEIETVNLPTPDKNTKVAGGVYELELCFEQEVPDVGWARMECRQRDCGELLNGRKVCKPASLKIDSNKLGTARNGVLQLSLMVPAVAERMTLKAKQGFFIEQTVSLPGADGRLLAQGITRRWRNVRLVQKNEWALESVKAVLQKAKAALEASGGLDVIEEELVEMAWCDPAKEVHMPRLVHGDEQAGTKPTSGTGKKRPMLFDTEGWLSPSSRLENLHPVTAVWLLNVLDKQRKARVRDEWAVPGFRKENPSPQFFGWVKKAGTRHVGEMLTLAVIDDDFGYDKENRVSLLAKQGATVLELAGGREFAPGGNIVQPFKACFWGDWTLELTDPALFTRGAGG